MSSADIAVKIFRQLENADFRVLQAIETAMSQHEFVPKELVAKFSKLDLVRDADFRLDRLSKMGLIYQMRSAYTGYTMNYSGYDCLAINALVKSNVIDAFGKSLGVGKEADVFDALTPENKQVAVKFHRLGRISFRQTQRKRGYTKEHAGWLFQSRLAAEKEFQGLRLVYPQGVAVPEPIAHNRHVLVMGMIEGAELAKWKKITGPKKMLKEILRNVRKAYLKAGVIHGDLSEYNVIVKPDMHILIIDWPQYMTKDHPNAERYLTRDVGNILQYFRRKYRVDVNIDGGLSYVKGSTRKIL
ncbi:MAG TPA: RIO1 family regulatory kinase/ATPase [Candidatus Eisenbacteria bacterium]|jgi:RIO kinase 2|nr:RIO1 family regulatory kinase/ATPase [Candidatus Eisenbacteria bacterium]